MPISYARRERSPGLQAAFAALAALSLTVPVFMIYLLVYDRQLQSAKAQDSIVQGWGGLQRIAGPVLVIPFWNDVTRTVREKGRDVERTERDWQELVIAPDAVSVDTAIRPERRHRSIYDAVVYQADNRGKARFALPATLARLDVAVDHLAYDRAELRFGVSDSRGLSGPRPVVKADGKALALENGRSSADGGAGFHTMLDAGALAARPIEVDFAYVLRGSGGLSLLPQAGDTAWHVRSTWPDPSFQGAFAPTRHSEGKGGFDAVWQVGNLALGKPLVAVGEGTAKASDDGPDSAVTDGARVDLITPLDLYDRINRAVKYGFLFIGFTFAAFLMFDLIGGVAVAAVEYLLVGAALVLFFVLLLAFAEVVGFLIAYLVAAGAIIGLISAYSASVLAGWTRGAMIGGMLMALYAVLYVLLGLEDYALLVGSLLLFAALAAVMFLTRRIDWGGARDAD